MLSLVLLYLMKDTQTALRKDQGFCVELQTEGEAKKESRGKVLRKYCWMYVKDSAKFRKLLFNFEIVQFNRGDGSAPV